MSQHLLLIDSLGAAATDGTGVALEFFTVPHPRHGLPTRYAVSPTGLWECQVLLEGEKQPSSWLVDADVYREGQLYVATVMDPLFLVLPELRKSASKVRSLFDSVVFYRSISLVWRAT
jgi:hypothetical protein